MLHNKQKDFLPWLQCAPPTTMEERVKEFTVNQIKEVLLQTNLLDFLADFCLTYVRNMLHIHDYLIKHKI